jgi:hypothetical protein
MASVFYHREKHTQYTYSIWIYMEYIKKLTVFCFFVDGLFFVVVVGGVLL